MEITQNDLSSFRLQLKSGSIQTTYKALLSYIMDLRTLFQEKFPGCQITGLYQGYLDMSYFAIVSPSLKFHNLKIAIVFNYSTFRFEAWLAATNRQIQRKYWELLRQNNWPGYRIATLSKGVDSIIEYDLTGELDLSDVKMLNDEIEQKVAKFICDIEQFLMQPGNTIKAT